MKRRAKQTKSPPRKGGHGGAREGAGRPRNPGPRKVMHRKRLGFSNPRPIHVRIRLVDDVGVLRKPKSYQVLHTVFRQTDSRGFRICHYSVQADHIHLIVEASDRAAMTAGMRAVNVRIGKCMNIMLERDKGTVIADRYDEQHLGSPRQVRTTLAYVLNNVRKHVMAETGTRCERGWLDPYSSAQYFDGWKSHEPVPITVESPVAAPRTLLLKKLWRKHGLIDIDAVPEVLE